MLDERFGGQVVFLGLPFTLRLSAAVFGECSWTCFGIFIEMCLVLAAHSLLITSLRSEVKISPFKM